LSCAAEQVGTFGYDEAVRMYGRRGIHWGSAEEVAAGLEVRS
jgi:hypothetical protein